MGLVTEALLRLALKDTPDYTLQLSKNDILTPSAKQFIREKGIVVVNEQHQTGSSTRKAVKENIYTPFETIGEFTPKFISHYDGGLFESKPEHMTHLRGNRLVYKDDKRIVLRGKLDSIQSLILEIQLQLKDNRHKGLLNDIDTVLDAFRNILKAEVLDTTFESLVLFGLSDEELRAHSHNPKKFYGVAHFIPSFDMGEEIVFLNKLRTAVRDLELTAVAAFRNGTTIEREDIIRALNRLSSAVYILMCRVRGNYYKQG